MVIFPGGAGITVNWRQLTRFGPGEAGYFWDAFHHRQSRLLCEVSRHGRAARKYCYAPRFFNSSNYLI